jgi:peptidyl-tRNA hydrolase, PTH1 family
MMMFTKSTAESNTFLLVGLGNPGREYRDTRHNVGFQAVDQLCASFGIKLSRLQSKALIGIGLWEGCKVVLVKPQTYMNLSGQAVTSLLRFYKVPLTQLLVFHDDIDLPVGTLRIRPGGGSAGQRGLASIIQQLGTQDFPRMRIGVGRPPGQMVAADYVLQNFTGADLEIISIVLQRSVDAARVFIRDGLEKTMNLYNGNVQKE